MFNKNRGSQARAIFDDVVVLKMNFPLKLNLIIGVTYLRVNPSNSIGNLIITPEIIQSLLR